MGNYALAAERFAVLVETQKTAENYFYMGMSNMEIGEYNTAVRNLNTVLNNFSTYQNQSKWYLSMALLAENKEDEAVFLLGALSLGESTYQKRSAAVLKKLNITTSGSTGEGESGNVIKQPEDVDSPDGSDFFNKRQIQFGDIYEFSTGATYRFHNEIPMDNLKDGDMVSFLILKKAKGKKGKGWAFILEKIM